jgi:hypothetical protein
MAIKTIFRDTHESLTEWTCGYCKQVAVTIRHGVAVCAQHKHLWTMGLQSPGVTVEAPAKH